MHRPQAELTADFEAPSRRQRTQEEEECASKTRENAEGRFKKWRREEGDTAAEDGRKVHLDKEACARDCRRRLHFGHLHTARFDALARRPCAADREWANQGVDNRKCSRNCLQSDFCRQSEKKNEHSITASEFLRSQVV